MWLDDGNRWLRKVVRVILSRADGEGSPRTTPQILRSFASLRMTVVIFVILVACRPRPEVPIGQWLWRIDGAWESAPNRQNVRLAPATILAFRSGNEYVELHTWLIEQPDQTVYIAARGPHVAVVGRWERSRSEIKVTRTNVARSGRVTISIEPCSQVTFHFSGNSLTGNAGGSGEGVYSPVTRLVSPDFESYVNEAKRVLTQCRQ